MKRPSLQFYPSDWRSNAKLRRCRPAERAAWIDLICLLHDSDEYGVLRWPLKEIAAVVGCKVAELRALGANGVLKGADEGQRSEPLVYVPRHAGRDGQPVTLLDAQDGPVWFSSRMVRDEYLRTTRGAGTRFGDAPKVEPIRREGDGASTSSSTSIKTKGPAFELPDWIPADAWASFVEMRQRIRKPMTGRAKELVVQRLSALRGEGHDPKAVLEQSTMNSWQGVFAIRGNATVTTTAPATAKAEPCPCGQPGTVKVGNRWRCAAHVRGMEAAA